MTSCKVIGDLTSASKCQQQCRPTHIAYQSSAEPCSPKQWLLFKQVTCHFTATTGNFAQLVLLFCSLLFNTDHLPEVNLSYNGHLSNDFEKDSRQQLFNFIASLTKEFFALMGCQAVQRESAPGTTRKKRVHWELEKQTPLPGASAKQLAFRFLCFK